MKKLKRELRRFYSFTVTRSFFKLTNNKTRIVLYQNENRILNFLQQKFGTVELRLRATDGKLSKQEYESKVVETLRQIGISLSTES